MTMTMICWICKRLKAEGRDRDETEKLWIEFDTSSLLIHYGYIYGRYNT